MEQRSKTTAKDFFLHLLSIVTLYGSAVAFLILIFQYVNILLPDKLHGGIYQVFGARATARGALATLIVVFPVYVWSTWFLGKMYAKIPEKRGLWVRRWLIYFTLFVAALIIIGDLVTLVRSLLEGEITTRFILKVVAVLFVAASVFGYYLTDIRKDKSE